MKRLLSLALCLAMLLSFTYAGTASASVVLAAGTETVITVQPTDVSAVLNSSAVFHVEARGEGLRYQWQQLKNTPDGDWVSIASYEGCQTDTMTVMAYDVRDGYQYRCVVSGEDGARTFSDVVTLTVTESVKITVDTVDCTAPIGGMAEYFVAASSSGRLTYEWQVYDAALDKWVPISSAYVEDLRGETTDTLTFRAQTRLENKLPVRCVVTDEGGSRARSTPSMLHLVPGDATVLRVTDFGADGTDTADDRKAMQSAINFAKKYATSDHPMTVYIPDGTYYLEDTLLMDSHMRLVLSDHAELVYTGMEGCMLMGGDGTQGSYETLVDVEISGGVWNANAASRRAHTEPIGLRAGRDIKISGLTMRNSSDHFIMLTGVKNATVTGCSFSQYVKIGEADQFTKEAVHIDFLPLPDGTLFPSGDITVANCTFDKVASGVGTHNLGMGLYENRITVKDCVFRNLLYNCVNAFFMSNITVSGCQASDCGAFLLASSASGRITDNEIDGAGNRCISLTDDTVMDVTDNRIAHVGRVEVIGGEQIAEASGAAGSQVYESIAILVRDSVGVVQGNTITGVDGKGIRVKNGKSLTKVSGNRVKDTEGIGVYVSNDKISVTRNTVENGQGIYAEFSEAEITGNTVKNSTNGIAFYCGTANISQNTVSGSAEYGIQITGAAESPGKADVTYNTVTGSGLADVRINTNCTGCLVAYNNPDDEIAISVASKAQANVRDNGKTPRPAAPEVRCSATDVTATLWWNAVSDASYYRVFLYNAADNSLKGLVRTTDTRVTVEALSPETEYTFVVVSYNAKDAACIYSVAANGVSLTTQPAVRELAIISHPADVTAEEGGSVSFTVKAQGTALHYQWYYKKAGAAFWSVWKNHNEATTYAVTNASWDGMQVYCVVTDAYGDTVSTKAAVIHIRCGLSIVLQSGDITAAAGELVAFSVEASGADLRYQWYYKKAGAAAWSKWNGHDTATTSAIVNASWDGMQVYCVVRDGSGQSVSSVPVVMTLRSGVSIISQPESVTAKVGQIVSFAVKASGMGLSYQWYYKKAGVSVWSKWNGHSGSSTSAAANASWDGMRVYCLVKDKNGSTASSAAATITIDKALGIVSHPQNVSVADGDAVSFAVSAYGVGLRYQWYYKKAGVAAWSKWNGHSTAVTSATANTSWNGMQVYCKVTDTYGETVSSQPAVITVTAGAPVILTQLRNVTAQAGASVSFAVTAQGSGLQYQWYYKKNGAAAWSKWNGHSTAVTSATANALWNGMQVYCEVTDSAGRKAASQPAVITVTADAPVILTQPQNVKAQAGAAVSFSVAAQGSGLQYQWYYRKAGATAWNKWNGHSTAATFATANATWNGMQVYCEITDSTGNRVSSGIAVVTIQGHI